MTDALEDHEGTVSIGGRTITNLRFADDIDGLAGEEEDATTVGHHARRIPHAIKDKLKKELDKMEESKIITRIMEPTDWVNSLVIVEKPNRKLRICLDPKVSKMTGAKF